MFDPEEKGDTGGLMGWLGLGELVKMSGGKWDWGGRREGREVRGRRNRMFGVLTLDPFCPLSWVGQGPGRMDASRYLFL